MHLHLRPLNRCTAALPLACGTDDEGVQYVLPDAVVLALALACPTRPRDLRAVLRLHGPPLGEGMSWAAHDKVGAYGKGRAWAERIRLAALRA